MTSAVLLPEEVAAPRAASTPARPRRWLPAVPFAVLLLLALTGPLLAPWDPVSVVATPSSAPSAAHWFGTDTNGMDVLSRVVTAVRLDVAIALSVTVLATLAALVVGLATPTPRRRCSVLSSEGGADHRVGPQTRPDDAGGLRFARVSRNSSVGRGRAESGEDPGR